MINTIIGEFALEAAWRNDSVANCRPFFCFTSIFKYQWGWMNGERSPLIKTVLLLLLKTIYWISFRFSFCAIVGQAATGLPHEEIHSESNAQQNKTNGERKSTMKLLSRYWFWQKIAFLSSYSSYPCLLLSSLTSPSVPKGIIW